MSRVGDVKHVLVRKLAADLQQDGQPTDAGVENGYRLFLVPGSRFQVRVHGSRFRFGQNREP
jgi:hypothetical protein